MTTPDYADSYDLLAEATGTTPGHALDQELRALHERHPAAFAAKVRETIDAYHAGRITSPWGFLGTTMRQLDQHRPVTEHAGPERAKALRLAETWIRNAGLHAPLAEAEAELFGRRGHLEPWEPDAELRHRIADYWRDQQPRADQAEADKRERARRWRTANPDKCLPDSPTLDNDELESLIA